MFRLIAFAVFALSSATMSSAYADESQWDSQFIHQTSAGLFEFTPGLVLDSAKLTYKNSSDTATAKGGSISANAEYGVNAMVSLGAKLQVSSEAFNPSCASGETCPNTTSKGLDDPMFYVNATHQVGPGAIRAGAALSISLGNHTVDSSGNSNAASGGVTLNPYVAYEFKVGAAGIVGAKLSYELYKGDRTTSDSSGGSSVSETVTGGNQLGAGFYYESKVSQMVTVGGALLYTSSNGSQTKIAGTGTIPNHDNTSSLALEAYVPIQFTDKLTLLPSLAAGSVAYPSSSGIDTDKVVVLGCAARIVF